MNLYQLRYFSLLGEDMQVRRAARREKPLHPAPHRIERLHEILEDGVGDAFHKGLVVLDIIRDITIDI